MATNRYISQSVRNEQNLYEDLIIESIQFYGQDVYYLPREIINKDKIFLDDVPSRFSESYKVEMYIENTEGFEGEGDLFTKFGIELRDQATFVVARKRWQGLIGDFLESQKFRPREGDLIFLPVSESIFQIMKVETESPFYQLSQLPTFRLQCELFEYNDEDFDTGIEGIDIVEQESAFKYELTMSEYSSTTAELTSVIDSDGKVTDLNIDNGGGFYTSLPTATFSSPEDSSGTTAEVTLEIENGVVTGGIIDNQGSLYTSPPTVTVTAPISGGSFLDNQTVTQVNTDYTIKGEVSTWNSETKILSIAHTGATDGKFHLWSTDAPVTSETASWIPSSIVEIQDIQADAQNEVFDDFEADFLDFSESNPFGDPL
tara:strand:- start:12229 stop:13347 length:1119 start_codon:yes stop_codon:yes gene_type:complete